MKIPTTAFSLVLIVFLISITVSLGQEAPKKPKLHISKETKLQLDDEMVQKLQQLTPKVLKDSFLLNKGYKVYDGKEVSAKLGIDMTEMKQYSLVDIKAKINNGGKLPLISPLFFQKNIGQSDSPYEYVMRSVNYVVGFHARSLSAIVMKPTKVIGLEKVDSSLQGNRIWLNFMGKGGTKLIGKKPIDARINSIIGNRKEEWHENIPGFTNLVTENLYQGVHLIYEAKEGRLEYMFMVEPKGSLRSIRISVKGVNKLHIDKQGNLIMNTSGGPIIQTKPRFFELAPKGEKLVQGEFVLFGKNEYGFIVKEYNKNVPLIIDPEIVFSTYFGGTGSEGGSTISTDGGSGDSGGGGYDVKIGLDGMIYAIGTTLSPDFPVTNASVLDASDEFAAPSDAFVLKIDPTLPTGQNLIYSTFIGGSREEEGSGIDVLDDGSVYITGTTFSQDFPISPGVVQTVNGNWGGFVAKLSSSGSFELGTFISNGDVFAAYNSNSIVFHKSADEDAGHVFIAGTCLGSGLSNGTPGSFQIQFAGKKDGFIVKLDSALTQYEYFSYLGGSSHDIIMDLDVVNGFAFVTGYTLSKDFPTTQFAFQKQHSENNNLICDNISLNGFDIGRNCIDAFVSRIDPSGSSLVYSTYYGQQGRKDIARGISVNNLRQAYITGNFTPLSGGNSDIFVVKFEAGGENFLWETLIPCLNIPNNSSDGGEELVIDQFGNLHVTGTLSIDGNAVGNGANSFNGGKDIFYARLNGEVGEVDFLTYLGGSGTDKGFCLDVDDFVENPCVTVIGSTLSNNIETINPIENSETRQGSTDLLIYTLCNVQATLGFSKLGPTSAIRGEDITYVLSIQNDGDVSIPAKVTDIVPAEIVVNEVFINSELCPNCHDNNTLDCTISAAPNGITTITIIGTILTDATANCVPVTITNTAILEVQGNEISKSATTQINCISPPPPTPGNISERNFLKAAPPEVTRGEVITYIITITNDGSTPVPVVFTDNVPPEINVTSIFLNGSLCPGCQNPLSPNDITFAFDADAGDNTIRIEGIVRSPPRFLYSCDSITSINTATLEVGDNTFIRSVPTKIYCRPLLVNIPHDLSLIARCGNGRVEWFEECDGTPDCRSNCILKRCGDGIVDPDMSEECDDGNTSNTDHCRSCRCIDLRREICSSNDECACEPGFSCFRASSPIVAQDCGGFWEGIGCHINNVLHPCYDCGDLIFEAEKRCNPNE